MNHGKNYLYIYNMGKTEDKSWKKYTENEIRVSGMNPTVKKELENIAENEGYSTLNSFYKVKLRELRDSYPENMRKAPTDY